MGETEENESEYVPGWEVWAGSEKNGSLYLLHPLIETTVCKGERKKACPKSRSNQTVRNSMLDYTEASHRWLCWGLDTHLVLQLRKKTVKKKTGFSYYTAPMRDENSHHWFPTCLQLVLTCNGYRRRPGTDSLAVYDWPLN